MDNDQLKEVSESSSEHLSGKTTKRTMKSEANLEKLPSDLRKQQRSRLHVPFECKSTVEGLTKKLDSRSMGAAVSWLLPSHRKTWVDLTKELGYEKGGQTIDLLLQRGSINLLSLTRERSLQTTKETLEWCVPTDTKPLVELTKKLGFANGAQTLDLLLSVTRPMVEELMSIGGVKDIPPTLSSAMNNPGENTWLAGMPLEIRVQNNRIVPGETSQRNFDQAGIYQTYHDVPMNPDIQHRIPGQSEFEDYDWTRYQNQGATQMGGTHGRLRGSSSKEEQQKYVGTVNKFVTDKAPKREREFEDVPMNQDIQHRIPGQSEFEFYDWTRYQNQGATQMGGTHGRHSGSSSKEEQQKYVGTVNTFVTDKAPKRQSEFEDVPMNQHIQHRIPGQSEFEDYDWTRYQNQGATQMGGTHGRHRGSSSKEEQKYAGKAPKRGGGMPEN